MGCDFFLPCTAYPIISAANGNTTISTIFGKNNIKIKNKLEKERAVLWYKIYLNSSIRPINYLLRGVNYVLPTFYRPIARNFADRVNLLLIL